MSKSILLKIQQSPEVLYAKALQAAETQGYTFVGDAVTGEISGSGIKGRYKFVGNSLIVTITEKPTLLSWDALERRLQSFVAG